MLSFVGRGSNLSPYFKATSFAVTGGKCVNLPPVVEKSDPPIVPPPMRLVDASSLKRGLLNRNPKATSTPVNVIHQLRFAHSDIKIPDFTEYRRNETKDPSSVNRDSADHRRAFTYVITGAVGALTAVTTKHAIRMFVGSMSATKDVLALAKIEVKLGDIPEGKNVVLKWRGKPLFVRHRTPAEIAKEQSVDVASLRDPETDEARAKNPEWLVVIGVCTHLGCVPIANAGDYGGYYCPCHGSHYDAAGRIRKGPAPLNLEIPVHEYDGELLIVG